MDGKQNTYDGEHSLSRAARRDEHLTERAAERRCEPSQRRRSRSIGDRVLGVFLSWALVVYCIRGFGKVLRRIFVENFRAFDELDISLSKVNLFFGPNNAGKSAILSAVNLLAQTLESADPYAAVLLRGKFEDLGSYRDMVYANDPKRRVKIGLGFDISEVVPAAPSRGKRRERETTEYEGELAVELEYQPKNRRIVVGGTNIKTRGETILATRLAEGGDRQVVEMVASRIGEISARRLNRLLQLNHFVPTLTPPFGRQWKQSDINAVFRLYRELINFGFAVNELLNGVEFIGPFRSKAERVYALSGESPSTVGVRGDKAVDVVISDYLARGKRRRGVAKKVSMWLQNAEIAQLIQPQIISPRHVEIQVSHFRSGEYQNLADVGYGCSQILPILAAGFSRPSGSTLIVEQPELHLHPKAQAELGTFVLDVKERGLQVLIETHSEHLLLRLQSHVASGKLQPEDVAIYYVYTDKIERKKKAKLLPLGADGLFKEKWPEGFFPERLVEAKRIAGFRTG
ncbi:MAG: AAA family ATPase [Dehalococcoidia bacterium]